MRNDAFLFLSGNSPCQPGQTTSWCMKAVSCYQVVARDQGQLPRSL